MTSDLALAAAKAALADAGLEAADIDLIVLATATPDNTFPSTAVAVQAALGITHGAAFDLQAVCSGFVLRSPPPTACCPAAASAARW